MVFGMTRSGATSRPTAWEANMLTTPWTLHIGTTSKFSLEQRHDLISSTFQRCANGRCPLGTKSF